MTTRPNLDNLTRLAEERDALRAERDELREALEALLPTSTVHRLELAAEDAKRAADRSMAALRAVLAVHPNMHGECWTCSNENGPHPWPCPTVRAIEEHVEVDRG